MGMKWMRGIIYGLAISLAIVFPRTPPNETICPYSIFLAPKYIGEKIGIIEKKDKLVVMHNGVCSSYFGIPFIYMADIYDVKPVYVSLTRLTLNLLIVFVLIETLIFGWSKIEKSRKINKSI